MWRWDQGRLAYFQYDSLRKIAEFAQKYDLKTATTKQIAASTGLPFYPHDPLYPPWRNYRRVFRVSLLSSLVGDIATPTKVAQLLAADGVVTSDEYLHFLASATTDPSPALDGWDATAEMRYPLLFSLKYLLAKTASGEPTAEIEEIIGAYAKSKFTGEEDETAFAVAIRGGGKAVGDLRQARESLRVSAQISYLHSNGSYLEVALSEADARDMFLTLAPVGGPFEKDSEEEIRRRADLFLPITAPLNFEYSSTIIGPSAEAGFEEGTKVEKTHLTIERNPKLRLAFFAANPTAVCDVCSVDTHSSFPWAERILDVHHLLPLSSGTRTAVAGTKLDDLVPNCPTCHRAVHRFYGTYLRSKGRRDFVDEAEARTVYAEVKTTFVGLKYA